MRWLHVDHPGRVLRLAYCLNLHAAGDLDGLYAGMRDISLPLRDRVASSGRFGVGMWFPAQVARVLASAAGRAELERLQQFMADERLDPFTFNAFPYADFQRDGLKADVYRPTWMQEERVRYTLDVASIAAQLNPVTGAERASAHVSISTHPGTYGAWLSGAGDLLACARNLARVVRELARSEAHGGPRAILALEAEPMASAGDTRELEGYLAFARAEIARALAGSDGLDRERAHALAIRHLGTCLDACHAAVEFEPPIEALACSTRGGPLGKLQFSRALAREQPGRDPRGRQLLLALAEPRFLHQVVGRRGERRLHAEDLPTLARALDMDGSDWLACSAWRCHFHVPVDLAAVEGLGTTRAEADALLDRLLARPEHWSTNELHVEIETYTWDVLPRAARGAGELVDALEREYRHVMQLLRERGWQPA